MKNLECIILIGVPASGKSTWSKDFLRKNPNFARLNRDDFRFMLRDQPVCEPKVEDAITQLFYNGIDTMLSKKMSLILDNTNLKKRYIDELVAYVEHRADVKFMPFPISLETAIERDSLREKSVGEEVLKKMYKDYEILMDSFTYTNQSKKTFIYKDPEMIEGLPKLVIFDLDGTLAHANGKRGYFDWTKCDRDDLDRVVYGIYQMHKAAGDRIFIVTGRSEEARQSTTEWLEFYGITYEQLLMRPADSFKSDTVVKTALYNEHIKGKFNVEVIYEDRQKVVDMWRSHGLKVFQVHKSD